MITSGNGLFKPRYNGKNRKMIRNVIQEKTADAFIQRFICKKLSISEAVCDVIRVGRVIIGKNILENNSSKKSLVAW